MFKQIRPLAFRLNPEIPTLPHTCATLVLPERWKPLLRELQASATNRSPDRSSIPISSLNRVVRALVPDIVAIGRNAGQANNTWLYSTRQIDLEALMLIIHAWVQHTFPKARDEIRRKVQGELRIEDLKWEVTELNLVDWQRTASGTAYADREHHFAFMPDVFAAIATDPNLSFEFGPNQLHFRRAPLAQGRYGAELISWPPLQYQDTKGIQSYSVMLAITAQTIPFLPYPVIYCDVGLRRWIDRPIKLPRNRTSVYLRTQVPWVKGLHLSQSFQTASLRWRRMPGSDKPVVVWDDELWAILNDLHPGHSLPNSEALVANPAIGRPENQASSALITYRTMMQNYDHGVGAGLMISDRRLIFDQLVTLFDSNLQWFEPFMRSAFKPGKISNPFFLKVKDGDFIEQEENASKRRDLISDAVGSRLAIEIYYQSPEIRDALVTVVHKDLGLPAELKNGCSYSTSEIQVDLSIKELGNIGDALQVNGQRNVADRAIDAAMRRVREIETRLPKVQIPTVSLVEISPKDSFELIDDPKKAIRSGFARSGRITQFIAPEKIGVVQRRRRKQKESPLVHRARSALRDAWRQLGVHLGTPIIEGVPEETNIFGIWLINRYAANNVMRDATKLPVIVHLAPGRSIIRATAPGFNGWLPYPEALRKLATGGARGASHVRDTLPFIRQTITQDVLALKHSLILCYAQNLRQAWPWVSNRHMILDSLSFHGEMPISNTDLPGLRLVRVRDSQQHETPEWFAQDKKRPDGFTQGLFQINQRVFASTYNLPHQFKNISRNFSRVELKIDTETMNDIPPRPDLPAWNPGLFELTVACLQPEDRDPTPWAALVHTLRHAAPHYDEALALPLPLHLAKLMEEYVFTVEDEDDE
jgi:hypothetical protein